MVTKIKELSEAFVKDAMKAQRGNKAAGVRSRKTSLELDKLSKEYRKVSLDWGK